VKERFAGRCIISTLDLTREEIDFLIEEAMIMKAAPQKSPLQGKILASCFFEPSTRTRLSFETAMLQLGGQVIGFSEKANTSAAKGETLHDAMKVISAYADLIVLRHPSEGSSKLAAEVAQKPVINAGDGANQHPTQTLADLFTIRESQKKLDGLKIAIVGDLKYGRTVHSLVTACAHFNIQLYFVCPPSLSLPEQICTALRRKGVKYSFHQDLEEVLDKVDILYMTRLQKERFEKAEDYLSIREHFTLKASMLSDVKKNLKILHPLPRNDEIATDVDPTPFAYYFEQAQNALYLRKALLSLLLQDQESVKNEKNTFCLSH
jgi:aspartate carbamoyltransferase catalytic subunit